MTVHTEFKLNTGAVIPAVGFGTYQATEEEGYHAVLTALEAGYRHIDAAFYYKNEATVGRALKDSGVPRHEIFVTTKCWPTQMRDPAKALDRSLELLGLDYVDMYMMHWPIPLKAVPGDEFAEGSEIDSDWDFIKTWELMEKIPKSKAKSIAVSNFTISRLEELMAKTSTVPAANQCELHPMLPQQELVDFCIKHNILPQAYRPLAKGQINNPILQAVAAKNNADVGQVALSWNVARGVCVLPKSVTPARIKSNLHIIPLDKADIDAINKIGEDPKRLVGSTKLFGIDIFNN